MVTRHHARLLLRSLVALMLVAAVAPAGALAAVPDSAAAVSPLAWASRASGPFGSLAVPSGVPDSDHNGDVDIATAWPGSPVSGSLNEDTDLLDVYKIELTEGQWVGLNMTFPSSALYSMELYGPETTSVWDDDAYPGELSVTYNLTTERIGEYALTTGTYYLVVIDWYGGGTYNISGAPLAMPAAAEIPGTPASTSGSVTDSLDWQTMPSRVYAFNVSVDDELTLTLTGPAGTGYNDLYWDMPTGGFDLMCYQVGQTTVWGEDARMPVHYSRHAGTSSESLKYHVPAGGGGTVYAEVNTGVTNGTFTLTSSKSSPLVPRMAGAERFNTSLASSKANFLTSDMAVVATPWGYPDALAASGLAGVSDAPLLLAPDMGSDSQYTMLRSELLRLGVKQVYIIGGTAVIGEDLDGELDWDGFAVKRVAGNDRYATARAVAEEIKRERPDAIDTVFVARGDSYADALAVSPFAFTQASPILLTQPGALPAATRDFIEANDILDVIIPGGTSAVSGAVAGSLDALNGGATKVERWAGTDRYSTAAVAASHAIGDRGWGTWDFVGIATGVNFPDALSGGASCGHRGGALLLTDPTSLSSPTASTLGAHRAAIDRAMIFGGTSAVNDATRNQIGAVLD